MSKWTSAQIPDQTGRTIIVTGANSGLGFETAKELARHGAHVILTARDNAKGASAIDRLHAQVPKADVELKLLDLADLDSVRDFAADINQVGQPLDAIINNAGVMWPPRTLTKQGFELQFATNHLGHFALTGLLLDRLSQSARSGGDTRIVAVSSVEHRGGAILFDDLTGERGYDPRTYYSQSKLANVLFGLELDRRLRAVGSPIRSVIAHPGYSATNLQTSGPTGLLRFFFGSIGNKLMAQPAAHGAWNEEYAATAPEVLGGQFIGPDGFNEYRGHPHVVQPDKPALDSDVARRLWELSEQLTGVTYNFR
ncbi:NAD(P)-dependent dehydrogenase, short-chain alcohol dehydrogenase family [Nocardia amikacinitolerans]|uniref:oxidoreductase n=1 Tax=Nocardia amikacinitolerans TaxID=756689 RepID=UPI0020A4FDAC|nr:oxidoreductase [Nocardia amikacinitolerans]MCP2299870.1 NAD(P)-dependent dehydrogenase, short-chain alcohol dehydrogenase family [Nocardia amikacinitolerans]MCP2300211.1 NAD(P)-dependent dehydrogenase, short-chain alcohol dehydrogenase family [Nocardia amikacinitolerans]